MNRFANARPVFATSNGTANGKPTSSSEAAHPREALLTAQTAEALRLQREASTKISDMELQVRERDAVIKADHALMNQSVGTLSTFLLFYFLIFLFFCLQLISSFIRKFHNSINSNRVSSFT